MWYHTHATYVQIAVWATKPEYENTYLCNLVQPVDDLVALEEELQDMTDLVMRDRNRASVLYWSFCNEGGCSNDAAAKPFREAAYAADGTRPVTQNHLGKDQSTQYLDIQGFSHKDGATFDKFHKQYAAAAVSGDVAVAPNDGQKRRRRFGPVVSALAFGAGTPQNP